MIVDQNMEYWLDRRIRLMESPEKRKKEMIRIEKLKERLAINIEKHHDTRAVDCKKRRKRKKCVK